MQEALEAASQASSEAEARVIVESINEQIREANRKGIAGPAIMAVPFDVERIVAQWRAQHEVAGDSQTRQSS
jgi:hypothetical protein